MTVRLMGLRWQRIAPAGSSRRQKPQVAVSARPNISYTYVFPNVVELNRRSTFRIGGMGELCKNVYSCKDASIMKTLFLLTIVGMLIASAPGCQSRRYCRGRNAVPTGPSATYEGMTSNPTVYGESGMAASTRPAPSGGCGPGCNCGAKPVPMLSSPGAFAPGPSTGAVLEQ